MVCGHHQPQQLTDDVIANVVVHDTASPRHQVCYQSTTKCPTPRDCCPSYGQLGRDHISPPAADARRPVHIVIDALRTKPDDVERRLRRLPTSQISCRILRTSSGPGRRSLADKSRKAIMPACNGRHWTGVVDTRTSLTDSYCRPQQRPTPAAYCHGKQNGDI